MPKQYEGKMSSYLTTAGDRQTQYCLLTAGEVNNFVKVLGIKRSRVLYLERTLGPFKAVKILAEMVKEKQKNR